MGLPHDQTGSDSKGLDVPGGRRREGHSKLICVRRARPMNRGRAGSRGALREIYPPRAHDIEVNRVAFFVDAEAPTVQGDDR